MAANQGVQAHMFVALDDPRFAVNDVIRLGDQCFLRWDFNVRMRPFSSAPQTMRGGSHLRPDGQTRIAMYRDYWDVAEELYGKLPAIGALMRWLKRRANV